jgi:hypothetical protein
LFKMTTWNFITSKFFITAFLSKLKIKTTVFFSETQLTIRVENVSQFYN